MLDRAPTGVMATASVAARDCIVCVLLGCRGAKRSAPGAGG